MRTEQCEVSTSHPALSPDLQPKLVIQATVLVQVPYMDPDTLNKVEVSRSVIDALQSDRSDKGTFFFPPSEISHGVLSLCLALH